MSQGRQPQGLPRHAIPLFLAGMALVVAPWAAPFSTPKLLLLAAGALVFAAAAFRGHAAAPRLPLALALGWLSWTLVAALAAPDPAPRAVLLDASAALLLVALLSTRWNAGATLRGIAWTGAAISLVVIVQAALPGPRLRMYGTLGNPDFCAAWLTVSLCAALPERKWLAAPQAIALACIGSFATLLALAAAALVARPRVALGTLLAGSLCVAAVGRSPARALEGRLYLHRVAAAHLADAPWFGAGAGSVRALWPSWEAARWASGAEDRAALPFAAAQDHVHDDWLERALEQGVLASLLPAALALLSLRRARRDPRFTAVAAGIAALCARAFVDFPLARPAELALFVTLVALPWQEE
jgi:hypothetical protein